MTAAELVAAWYEIDGNEAGGALHIVTDDGNVSDDMIQWCVANLDDWHARWYSGGMPIVEYRMRFTEVVDALLLLAEAQRLAAVLV